MKQAIIIIISLLFFSCEKRMSYIEPNHKDCKYKCVENTYLKIPLDDEVKTITINDKNPIYIKIDRKLSINVYTGERRSCRFKCVPANLYKFSFIDKNSNMLLMADLNYKILTITSNKDKYIEVKIKSTEEDIVHYEYNIFGQWLDGMDIIGVSIVMLVIIATVIVKI